MKPKIKCDICHEPSHPTADCPMKRDMAYYEKHKHLLNGKNPLFEKEL